MAQPAVNPGDLDSWVELPPGQREWVESFLEEQFQRVLFPSQEFRSPRRKHVLLLDYSKTTVRKSRAKHSPPSQGIQTTTKMYLTSTCIFSFFLFPPLAWQEHVRDRYLKLMFLFSSFKFVLVEDV